MTFLKSILRSKVRSFLCILVASGVAGVTCQSEAQYSLNHLNSQVTFDVGLGSGSVSSWSVDGANQLYQQWYYYRIGGGQELPLESIDATPTVTQSAPDRLEVTYANSQVSVNLIYILTGGTPGSGQSGINATVSARNLTANALDLHFFQYSDFDLGGAAAGDSVLFTQSLGRYNKATQSDGGSTLTHTFTSGLNPPSRVEAALYDATLTSLTDGSATTLNGVTSLGPGDVTYAIQWDALLNSAGITGDALSIGQVMSLQVPEPSFTAILAAGVVLLGGARWQRRK